MFDAARTRALVTDYDRTLTTPELRLEDATGAALRRLRAAGVRVVVASGRPLDFLQRNAGDFADALVAENGAVVAYPAAGPGETLCEQPAPHLAALEGVGVPFTAFTAMASFPVEHEERVRQHLRAAGVEARLERNRDEVMVLPPGVTKAAGALRALDHLDVPPAAAVAMGDGENDLPLFAALGSGVAVANAVPALRERAHHVVAAGGAGVRHVAEDIMAARGPHAPGGSPPESRA